MRSRIPQPYKPAVVKMRVDRGDRSSRMTLFRQLRAPSARIKMRKQKLVHCIIDGISFDQDIASLGQPVVRR